MAKLVFTKRVKRNLILTGIVFYPIVLYLFPVGSIFLMYRSTLLNLQLHPVLLSEIFNLHQKKINFIDTFFKRN